MNSPNNDHFHEEIFSIQSPCNLHGVISRPAQLIPEKPALLILNAGLVHHIGPCRTSVTFAREMAAQGYFVIRFDLSNLGDSPVRSGGPATDEARIVEEIKTVMDYIQEHVGINKFVIFGLCSGSQDGVKTAVHDSRVVGLAGVDTFGYRTWQYYCYYYGRKLMGSNGWQAIGRKIGRILKIIPPPDASADEHRSIADAEIEWSYPPRHEVQEWYSILVNRGVRFFYVFSGDWVSQYCYAQQFFHMYPKVDFKNLAEVAYKPEMSHIMVEPSSQRYVSSKLNKFMASF